MTNTKELIGWKSAVKEAKSALAIPRNMMVSNQLIIEANDRIEQLQSRKAELQADRDALAAHVDRFKSACEMLYHWHDSSDGGMVVDGDIVRELWELESTTPQHSLAAMKAELASKAEKDLIHALFYAPSSPIKPDTAWQVEKWYEQFKASKRVKDGE